VAAAAVEIAMYESLACAAAVAAADEASSRYVPLITTLSSSPKEKDSSRRSNPRQLGQINPPLLLLSPTAIQAG
jgi:hypothetical protein